MSEPMALGSGGGIGGGIPAAVCFRLIFFFSVFNCSSSVCEAVFIFQDAISILWDAWDASGIYKGIVIICMFFLWIYSSFHNRIYCQEIHYDSLNLLILKTEFARSQDLTRVLFF